MPSLLVLADPRLSPQSFNTVYLPSPHVIPSPAVIPQALPYSPGPYYSPDPYYTPVLPAKSLDDFGDYLLPVAPYDAAPIPREALCACHTPHTWCNVHQRRCRAIPPSPWARLKTCVAHKRAAYRAAEDVREARALVRAIERTVPRTKPGAPERHAVYQSLLAARAALHEVEMYELNFH
jgi:hypothetical protein